LVAKSNGSFVTSTFDDVLYMGDLEVWFPSNREHSSVAAVPVFVDAANSKLIPTRYEDIVSAEPLHS
jgi:hypothetical protein